MKSRIQYEPPVRATRASLPDLESLAVIAAQERHGMVDRLLKVNHAKRVAA